jgi:hypothetical protein
MSQENGTNLGRSVELSQLGKKKDSERFDNLEKKSKEVFLKCKGFELKKDEFREVVTEGFSIRLTNTTGGGYFGNIRGVFRRDGKTKYTLRIDKISEEKKAAGEFIMVSVEDRAEVPFRDQSYKDQMHSFELMENSLELLKKGKKSKTLRSFFL